MQTCKYFHLFNCSCRICW